MSAKKILTEEEIITITNNFGFKYVDGSYDNKKKTIKIICPNNHETKTEFYEFKNVIHKCITCKKKIKMPKMTIELLREEMINLNFELLSEKYEGCHGIIEFICDNGHKTKVSDKKWKKVKRCPDCAKKQSICDQKLSYEFVKKCFTEKGYELLSTNYVNKNEHLLFKCPNGHINTITFDRFHYDDNRCGDCSKSKKLTFEQVKNFFEQNNYILLSTSYVNCKSPLEYKCPNGHINTMNYTDFRCGNRCGDCCKNKKLTIEKVKKFFENKKCILISDTYVNSKSLLEYKCPFGHITSTTYDSFLHGTLCSDCSQSNGELATKLYLEKLKLKFTPEIKFEQCKNERYLPFDFYVNDQFIIEFDGIQHFKSIDFFGGEEALKKRKLHDKIKTNFCFDYHIPLLRISYDCIKDIPTLIDNFIIQIKKDRTAIKFSNPSLYDYLEFN